MLELNNEKMKVEKLIVKMMGNFRIWSETIILLILQIRRK